MRRDRFGSLFENVLSKLPDVADRLRSMAKRSNKTSQSDGKPETTSSLVVESKTSFQKKKSTDRRVNSGVKRKRNPRRPAAKAGKPKRINNLANEKKRSRMKNAKSGIPPKPIPKPDYSHRFFPGIPENADQFESNADQFESNNDSHSLDVVIGLDFGTSSTKVVVQVPHYPRKPAFAIPFGPYAHKGEDVSDYLLPTRLAVNRDDHCNLLPSSSSSYPADMSILTDIKISLMNSPHGSVRVFGKAPSKAAAVCFKICSGLVSVF